MADPSVLVPVRPGGPAIRVLARAIVPEASWVPEEARAGGVLIAWSGTLAEEPGARDWATWGPAGRAALDAACADIGPALETSGTRLLLRPHARHVLSDPFKCRRFLDERGAGPFGVALDAASMLEHSMLADAEGHIERAFEMLGPIAGAIILAGVEPGADEDAPVRPCPTGRGVVSAAFLIEMVRRHAPVTTPLLALEDDGAGPLAALGPAD